MVCPLLSCVVPVKSKLSFPPTTWSNLGKQGPGQANHQRVLGHRARFWPPPRQRSQERSKKATASLVPRRQGLGVRGALGELPRAMSPTPEPVRYQSSWLYHGRMRVCGQRGAPSQANTAGPAGSREGQVPLGLSAHSSQG